MNIFVRRKYPSIVSFCLIDKEYTKEAIKCAISTKELTRNLSRVKSSNLWSAGINVKDQKSKTGDMLIQFKDKNGGPGDIYIYYDVPILTYRKFVSAPSKGHAFWKLIRNYFKYAKLTGNKHGVLPNAVR